MLIWLSSQSIWLHTRQYVNQPNYERGDKRRGVGGRAFHLSTHTVALWHCPFPTRNPRTHTHTHTCARTHTRKRSCISFREGGDHFSLGTDKLDCTISCSKLSTAKRAPVSNVTFVVEKWIHLLRNILLWHYIPIRVGWWQCTVFIK